MRSMAKKSSGNAVAKINKQIIELTSKANIEDKESIPVISKKEIETVINKTTISKSIPRKKNTKTCTAKIKNSREKIIIADDNKKKNTKKTVTRGKTAKKQGLTNKKNTTNLKKNSVDDKESTIKIKKLEKEMRSLYDRVNDIVEDLDYQKTVTNTDDVILSDFLRKEKIQETKLDKVSDSFLDKILKIVFTIFMILFTTFIGFVIFVSTF